MNSTRSSGSSCTLCGTRSFLTGRAIPASAASSGLSLTDHLRSGSVTGSGDERQDPSAETKTKGDSYADADIVLWPAWAGKPTLVRRVAANVAAACISTNDWQAATGQPHVEIDLHERFAGRALRLDAWVFCPRWRTAPQ